jgi:anti-sigma28 factor (negative regulator of flagellin synthesis)
MGSGDIMRITRRSTTSIPGVGDLAAPSESSEAGAATTGGPVTDRVQLSEAARLRQRLKSEIGDPAGAATTTPDRIAALQTEVASRTYAPNPRAVADSLLGEIAANLLA